MDVAIVNHYDFGSNSGIHVFNLANRLVVRGIAVTVYVPGDPATVGLLGEPRFDVRPTTDLPVRRFDIAHAWTPRPVVRDVVMRLVERDRIPYVVHLEDNEDVVAAYGLGLGPERLRGLNRAQLSQLVRSLPAASPHRYHAFVERAAGVTAVVRSLLEFAPEGKPSVVFWPGFEPELFRPTPPDVSLRREIGLRDNERVVVYAGNTHSANAEEVRTLYLAVGLVNARGTPLRLIRLGDDYVDFLGPSGAKARRHEIRVPYVERVEVPRYFALADVLVQPGRPGAFNDYRFPSKLPEFLAMGKPVVLPATNIGLELEDGVDAMLLRRGDPLELAAAIGALLADPALRERLGSAARRFAESRLSWDHAADAVARLYGEVLAKTPGTR